MKKRKKEIQKILAELEITDYTLSVARSGHLQIQIGKRKFHTSASPSDHRSNKNLKSWIKKEVLD